MAGSPPGLLGREPCRRAPVSRNWATAVSNSAWRIPRKSLPPAWPWPGRACSRSSLNLTTSPPAPALPCSTPRVCRWRASNSAAKARPRLPSALAIRRSRRHWVATISSTVRRRWPGRDNGSASSSLPGRPNAGSAATASIGAAHSMGVTATALGNRSRFMPGEPTIAPIRTMRHVTSACEACRSARSAG